MATLTVPSALAVSTGIWIRTGSRHERDSEAGRSHLLEHMLFRGTPNYGPGEVDRRFEAFGGEINAATSHNETTVAARVLADDLGAAFPMLAEMVAAPSVLDEYLDVERRVVLEEIAMIDDSPEDQIFELLPQAVYGAHPLARPVIGTREVVESTDGETLRRFHASHYRPERIVVAAVGAVDHDRICALAESAVPRGLAETIPADDHDPGEVPPSAPTALFRQRETEQVQVAIAGRGLPMGHPRRYALRVLDTILGGSPASRLFRAIREQRGLAYAVTTFDDQHQGGGLAGVYLGTRPENLAEAVEVVAEELDRVIRDPVDDDELTRAKQNARSRLLLTLESTSARVHGLGQSVLHGLPLRRAEEVAAEIDAVTAEQIQVLAADLYAHAGLSAAGVGPDEDAFRAALAPLVRG